MKTRLTMLGICGVIGFPLFAFASSLFVTEQEKQRQYVESLVNQGISNVSYPYNDGIEVFFFISIILALFAAGVMILIAYSGGTGHYEYYNRREAVDLGWSLPVKNKHRFWGDFLTGIAPMTLVYVVSGAIGLLIVKIGFPKEITEQIPQLFPLIISLMFIGLLFLFSIYIISIFCAALCGRAFEAGVYPAVICGVIPATIALFGTMIFSNVWQIDVTYQLMDALRCSSPFGFLIGGIDEIAQFMWRFDGEILLKDYLIFREWQIIIPFVLIHGGFLTGAYYLGKKRKAENTGKAFAFKYAHEIISSLVMFCITAVFCYLITLNSQASSGLIFGLFTCTAIAYLILDVTAKRGFHKMGKAAVKYICMVAGSVVLSVILLNTNGFGAGQYVPELNQIKSVKFYIPGIDQDEFMWARYFVNGSMLAEYEDAESIKIIRDVHIQSNKIQVGSGNFFFSNYSDTYVIYTLENGKEVRRNIRFDKEFDKEPLLALAMSNDYRKGNVAALEAGMKDGWKPFFITTKDFFGNTIDINERADMTRIIEAYKADYLAETFQQRYLSAETNHGIFDIRFQKTRTDGGYQERELISSVVIRAHYTNLIAELERQGISTSFEQLYEGMDEEERAKHELMRHESFQITKRENVLASGNPVYWEYSDKYLPYHVWRTAEENEEIDQLFDKLVEVAQPHYLIKGEGYIIQAGWTFVIPPQYSHLAEQLYDMMEGFYFDEMSDWEKKQYEEMRKHLMSAEAVG